MPLGQSGASIIEDGGRALEGRCLRFAGLGAIVVEANRVHARWLYPLAARIGEFLQGQDAIGI